jgi:hypothetical protein
MTTTNKTQTASGAPEAPNLVNTGIVAARECFAIPGEDSIIDCVHPVTGLTCRCGETLEQVRERYPNAIKMSIADHCTLAALRQDTPIAWEEITHERYSDYLECLPPAAYARDLGAFLAGEPTDHHALSGRPRYTACETRGGKCYASTRPLTKVEFRAICG